ncbi:hypothetical protein K5E_21640 [Enterococcus thailandicus]|uniref:hypothetical protein n=1 Tax=Enterococcus thailandicus TaxID=417368 RepID=UPI00244D8A15|nr:hypothetical protein [Enterococcus thailandicus]GMC02499.1 hypothetical protein K4E_00090 [Enterococcus thailandicus]GMC10025.1 hypothetical protein K5E_21640 [Enterococcus thailandicus]
MAKRLSEIVDFSKLPEDTKEMIKLLPPEGEQALVEMYDKDSDFIKYGAPDKIAQDFLLDNEDTILCHYTNYDNLPSILENKKFWIKSKSYMNDPQEFEYTYVLGKEILKDLGASTAEIDQFVSLTESVNFDAYIWSFSENINSQALWGNYGSNNGIALKMKKKEIMFNLAKHFAKGKISLEDYEVGNAYVFPLKVLYDLKEQKLRLSAVLSQFLRALRSLKFDPYDMQEIIKDCLGTLSLYAFILKNPLLYQEEEIRFIINNIIENNQISPEFKINNTPFVSCPISKDLISEVVIKTGSNISNTEVEELLVKYGFDNVKVSNSLLPY